MIAKRLRGFGTLPGDTAALFVLLPLIGALLISGDYAQWWRGTRGWQILFETLCFAGLSAATAIAAGAVVARAGWPWLVAACVPLVLPASLIGSAWIVAWGRSSALGGWVNVYDWPIAAAVVGLRYAGLAGMILLAQKRPADPAAKVFAVRRAWWWLGLRPRLRPVLLAWVVVLLWTSTEPIMPSMFLIHTYSTQVLIQANALLDPAGAVALVVPMMLAGAVAIGVLAPRRVSWTSAGALADASHQPGGAWLWRGGAGAVLLLILGVPLAALGMRVSGVSAVAAAWREAWPELRHTLWLAGTAAPAGTLLGGVLGAGWQRALRQRRPTLVPITLLVVVIPPAVLALGWIELANRWPLVRWRDTSAVLWLAYVMRFAPIAAVMFLIAGLRRAESPDAAAEVHGLSWARRFLWITWPAYRRTAVCGVTIVALLIAIELEMSLLLTPAGTNTVGVRLYTLIHTAPDAQIAATSLAVVLTFLPLIAVGWAVLMWRRP